MSTNSARGVTLIELILVVTLVGVVFIPLLLTYGSYRTARALQASSEAVANHATSAHIFARDAKSQKEWGIKSTNDRTYAIYSSGASGEKIENSYSLEQGVTFSEDFTILFHIGRGTTSEDSEISLTANNGVIRKIMVSASGIVEEIR